MPCLTITLSNRFKRSPFRPNRTATTARHRIQPTSIDQDHEHMSRIGRTATSPALRHSFSAIRTRPTTATPIPIAGAVTSRSGLMRRRLCVVSFQPLAGC